MWGRMSGPAWAQRSGVGADACAVCVRAALRVLTTDLLAPSHGAQANDRDLQVRGAQLVPPHRSHAGEVAKLTQSTCKFRRDLKGKQNEQSRQVSFQELDITVCVKPYGANASRRPEHAALIVANWAVNSFLSYTLSIHNSSIDDVIGTQT